MNSNLLCGCLCCDDNCQRAVSANLNRGKREARECQECNGRKEVVMQYRDRCATAERPLACLYA